MYSELVQWRGEVISRAQGLVGFWFDTKTNSPPTAGAPSLSLPHFPSLFTKREQQCL